MPRRPQLLPIAAFSLILMLVSCGPGTGSRAQGWGAAIPATTWPATPSALPIPASTPTGTPLLAATPSPLPTTAPTATPEDLAAIPPASCPVTRPPEPPFSAPPPYPPAPPPVYAGQFWYGTEELWTLLRADGLWQRLPRHNGAYGQKVFWWRQGYDWRVEPEPALTVTGRRLDAPAPPFASSGATNGFRDDIGSFMLVGVGIPTAGCWEITGRTAGAELSFVVWVAP
jgi:hypothetical protein